MENSLCDSFTMGTFFFFLITGVFILIYDVSYDKASLRVSTIRFSYEIYYIWFPGKSLCETHFSLSYCGKIYQLRKWQRMVLETIKSPIVVLFAVYKSRESIVSAGLSF